jgi:hypothetical protein
MKKKVILGVQLIRGKVDPVRVQEVLVRYGSHIKTRLGLHEVESSTSRALGLLLVETCGDLSQIKQMEASLQEIPGVMVKKMVFPA